MMPILRFNTNGTDPMINTRSKLVHVQYLNPAAMFPAYVTGLSCAAAGGCSTQNHAPANPGHH